MRAEQSAVIAKDEDAKAHAKEMQKERYLLFVACKRVGRPDSVLGRDARSEAVSYENAPAPLTELVFGPEDLGRVNGGTDSGTCARPTRRWSGPARPGGAAAATRRRAHPASPEHTRLMGARYTSPPGRAKAPVGQTIGDGTSHLLAELHRPSQCGSEAFQLAEGLPIHPLLLDGQHRSLCPAAIPPLRG